MKNYIFIFVLFISCFLLSSNHIHSQEQHPNVPVSVEKINDEEIYTFVDQRDIPDENVERFINRIKHLYENVDSVYFDPKSRMFSVKFSSTPSKEYLESVFHHFKVNKYTLN